MGLLLLPFLLAVAAIVGSVLIQVVSGSTYNASFSTSNRNVGWNTDKSNLQNTGLTANQPFIGEDIITDNGINDIFPSELYHSLQEPFRSFPCYPKYIHLSQGSNTFNPVDSDDLSNSGWVVNMTISLALDYISCPCALPIIEYGGPINSDSVTFNNKSYLHHTDRSNRLASTSQNNKVVKVPIDYVPLQFNYTSDKTNGETYQSDWIYHVPIPQLQGGRQTYWYRIIVKERNDCPTYLQQNWNIKSSSIPNIINQQQQRRSLRGSNGYYIGETKTYTFITPPIPGQATSIALVGDLGQTTNSAQTIYNVYKRTAIAMNENHDKIKSYPTVSKYANVHSEIDMPPISQLLIAGDMSYADSDPVRWTSFLALIEPLVRTIPLHVVAGNHEIECDSTTNNLFVPYEHWFRVPNRIQSAIMEPISDEYKQTLWDHSCSAPSVFQGVYNYGNSFYSFQHGLSYIIVLNSYTNCTKGSTQYEWLLSELKLYHDMNYRKSTPWLLISFHSPLYTTVLGHVNEKQAVDMKLALEPIFIRNGVNIIVSGHDHTYMRTYPLAYNQVDTTGKAPIYLTLGAAGNREGHAPGYRNPFQKEPWVAKRTLNDFGYGHLFIPNATHAKFQWVRDRTTNNDFEDIVWLYNHHAAQ